MTSSNQEDIEKCYKIIKNQNNQLSDNQKSDKDNQNIDICDSNLKKILEIVFLTLYIFFIVVYIISKWSSDQSLDKEWYKNPIFLSNIGIMLTLLIHVLVNKFLFTKYCNKYEEHIYYIRQICQIIALIIYGIFMVHYYYILKGKIFR